MVALIVVQPFPLATSQTIGTIQSSFNQAIVAVHQAESAGATSSEVSELVILLNKALELDREAMTLNAPNEAEQRSELLAQANQILTTVQNRAADLTVTASQRTYTTKVLTYVGGAIAAALGTIIYAFSASFYQKYRIKRTFQMKVTRK